MMTYEQVIGTSGDIYIGGKRVGTVETWGVDFSAEVEFFAGDMQYPSAALVKARSCVLKAKSKTFDAALMAEAFHGLTPVAGETLMASETFGTSGAGPHVVAQGATHVAVLEVRDGTGARMKLVASAPAVGEYTVVLGTGSYGFNASEVAGKVIEYTYTLATGSKTATFVNAKIGKAATVEFYGFNSNIESTKPLGLRLFTLVPTKPGSLGFKLDGFQDGMDFEATAMANSAGNVGSLFYDHIP